MIIIPIILVMITISGLILIGIWDYSPSNFYTIKLVILFYIVIVPKYFRLIVFPIYLVMYCLHMNRTHIDLFTNITKRPSLQHMIKDNITIVGLNVKESIESDPLYFLILY